MFKNLNLNVVSINKQGKYTCNIINYLYLLFYIHTTTILYAGKLITATPCWDNWMTHVWVIGWHMLEWLGGPCLDDWVTYVEVIKLPMLGWLGDPCWGYLSKFGVIRRTSKTIKNDSLTLHLYFSYYRIKLDFFLKHWFYSWFC